MTDPDLAEAWDELQADTLLGWYARLPTPETTQRRSPPWLEQPKSYPESS